MDPPLQTLRSAAQEFVTQPQVRASAITTNLIILTATTVEWLPFWISFWFSWGPRKINNDI